MNNNDKKTILLVEDEVLLALSEKMELEEKGYIIHHVTTGEDAVKTVLDNILSIDLILMDIDLGSGIDGTRAAEKILNQRDIPVVFLSSRIEPEVVEKTEKITSYGYVVKDSGIVVLDTSIKMAFKLFNANNRITQSEEKHRTLFETMSPGVVYHAADGTIISANPASEKLLGLSFDQMNGKTSMDHRWKMITEDYEEVPGSEHPTMIALRTGKKVGPITRGVFVPETGEYVWLLISAIPLFRTGEDKPYQVYATFDDISEQKRADDALKESREKIASILKAAPTGIGVVQGTKKRTIVEANEKLCLMTGYSCDELIGKSARTLYPSQEDFDYVGSEKYRQIKARGSGSVETRWKKKDGTVIEVLLASSPIHPSDISLGVTFTAMDITERKKAEEDLRRFKTISDNAFFGQAIADLQGELLYVNQFFANIHGYEPEDLIGKNLSVFHNEQQKDTVDSLIVSLLQEGNFKPTTVWHCHREGTEFPMLMSGILIKNDKGNPQYIAASAVDISDQLHSEDALRKSEAMKNSMISNIGNVIVIIDQNGINQYKSPNITKLFGWKPEELVGKSTWDNVHPDDLEAAQIFFSTILTEPNAAGTAELRYKRKDGNYVWIEMSVTNLLHDKYIQGILGNYHDIAERKTAQIALRESMKRYNDLVALIPVGVYIFWVRANGHLEFEYVSDRWCEIHGLRREDVMRDAAVAENMVHPDDRESFLKRNRKAARDQKPFHWEGRFLTGDGELRQLRIESTPVVLENGDIQWFGVTQDITDRKQAEEEIQKQLYEKEILLREVHHRVKNNIVNIESLLSMQAGSNSNPEVKAALQDSISRIHSMRILYNKLLLSEDLREIPMKNYTEDLIESIHDVFANKDNITIEKYIANFEFDAGKAIFIGIIINELLTNVFKYAFKDHDKGTVSVSIEKNENMVSIIVQDNGIGIDEKIEANKTSGFGLTIVKMLVKQLHGTYSVVNENGTKSVIQFEI